MGDVGDVSHLCPCTNRLILLSQGPGLKGCASPCERFSTKHKGGFWNGNLSCLFGPKILVSTVGVISLQPMAAAEKLGKAQAICGVTVTGCRNFEGSIDFRRDLDTESRYSSFRDRNRVCLIGCDIRGIWNELSVSVREVCGFGDCRWMYQSMGWWSGHDTEVAKQNGRQDYLYVVG
jgi:nitrate reductase NapE component